MKPLLILLLALAPVPALALSCLKPSVERSFNQYDEAAESYLIVHGRLTLDEGLLPKTAFGQGSPPKMTMIPGRLVGKSLSKAGFELPFERDVTLEVACFGPWCGSLENGADVLAFVRKDQAGYAIDINPCGGAVFSAPHRKLLKSVERCMRGGPCEPDMY
ncbi:MAG: hypothetical protein HKN30_03675 [Sulfitobacter sp.]|nr:hypothetical protein [Sulfitobacter sp.]